MEKQAKNNNICVSFYFRHALLTRYSQGILRETYSGSEVVLVGEFVKLFFSMFLSIVELNEGLGPSLFRLIYLLKNCHKVVVLSGTYMIQNILTYYALARVDASSYTVFLQLKVYAFIIIIVYYHSQDFLIACE